MFKKLLNKFQTMLIELEVYNLSDKIIPVPINLKITCSSGFIIEFY